MSTYDEVFHYLKKNQSKARFHHSVGVGELAARLGKTHGWNPKEARLTGLLHDVAKEWSPKRLISYVKKNKISVPDLSFIKKHSPNLLHAYAGAHFVKKKGWIRSASSVKAIASHTLGSKTMNLQEKILFIADFAAPDRTFSASKKVAQVARKDLRTALRLSMAFKLQYNLLMSKPLHPLTLKIWNHSLKPL